jgi:hypothetical protein
MASFSVFKQHYLIKITPKTMHNKSTVLYNRSLDSFKFFLYKFFLLYKNVYTVIKWQDFSR